MQDQNKTSIPLRSMAPQGFTPVQWRNRIKAEAASQGVSMNVYIMKAIQAYMGASNDK